MEDTKWKKNWISEIHIEAILGGVKETTEYLAYDITDFFGDVGGYMGLLLGWSLLGLTIYATKIPIFLKNYFQKPINK